MSKVKAKLIDEEESRASVLRGSSKERELCILVSLRETMNDLEWLLDQEGVDREFEGDLTMARAYLMNVAEQLV
jgi:hypothetical protein